jgi:hypothetical protein
MPIHQHFIDFFLMLFFFASFFGAIGIFIHGEVELKYRLLWGAYRHRYLRGKPAYSYGACQLVGSSIMLAYILSYTIFAVTIDINVVILLICGLALGFYTLSGMIIQKYGETS